MTTVFSEVKGELLVYIKQHRLEINTVRYCETPDRLRKTVYWKWPGCLFKDVILLNNTSPHTWLVWQKMTLPHPPPCPDLASVFCWLTYGQCFICSHTYVGLVNVSTLLFGHPLICYLLHSKYQLIKCFMDFERWFDLRWQKFKICQDVLFCFKLDSSSWELSFCE